MFSADEFLEKVYSLSQEVKTSGALSVGLSNAKGLDLIFETLDDMMGQGDFNRLNNLLKKVELKRLNSTLMVGFLSITNCARQQLPYRENFGNDVIDELRRIKRIINFKETNRLLGGLLDL